MSFLYPRLLAEQARPLFEEYRHLTTLELAGRVTASHESAVYVATGGDRVSTAQLRELRVGVVDLAKRAGFPDDSDRARNTDFDLRLAALLHAEMGMVPAEAASRDVWAFLALILLPDVAFWRYPQPPKDRILGTDLTRHVFGRLWWRAQLVRSSGAPEPYGALVILGEAAFDQIYARRAALGGSPHMVRAILRVWKDLDLAGLNERETLRDFLKRLLRLAPFVLFDGIEEHALDDELRTVAQESVNAQRIATDNATKAGETVQTSHEALNRRWSPRAIHVRLSSRRKPPIAPACSGGAGRRPADSGQSNSAPGAGAQALGLEQAGFDPVLLIDSKADACFTIDLNRPALGRDLHGHRCTSIRARVPRHMGVDSRQRWPPPREVVLPSVGRSRGHRGARSPQGRDHAGDATINPKGRALSRTFRTWSRARASRPTARGSRRMLGESRLPLELASPQCRRLSACRRTAAAASWSPCRTRTSPDSPGPNRTGCRRRPSAKSSALPCPQHGWPGAERWIKGADRVAPALVGGSDRRGGADLGPTGTKKAWACARRERQQPRRRTARGLSFPADGQPKLTVDQAAMIQVDPQGLALLRRQDVQVPSDRPRDAAAPRATARRTGHREPHCAKLRSPHAARPVPSPLEPITVLDLFSGMRRLHSRVFTSSARRGRRRTGQSSAASRRSSTTAPRQLRTPRTSEAIDSDTHPSGRHASTSRTSRAGRRQKRPSTRTWWSEGLPARASRP
jgi:hypothetical protein